ncbi:MAG TPA: M6 family metalloprotease domain-containing protein, partial [Nitrospirota bacterium]
MKTRLFALTVAALVALAGLPSLSLAVPASPDIVEVGQPGGGRFNARIMGDEFQGWVETVDGYSVAQDKSTGVWEFAVKGKDGRLAPSGKRVAPGASAPAGTERHLKPPRDNAREKSFSAMLQGSPALAAPSLGNGGVSPQGRSAPQAGPGNWNPAPVFGTRNLLIILVNFNDRTLNTTAFGWDTTTMSTAPGGKSVANFYMDNSFNALTIMPVMHTQAGNPAGIVTVTVASNHPNYGGNFDYEAETAWLTEALAQAASYVDFAALDTNQDGYFDNMELVVYFIPAGYEASGSGNVPNIWAHAWGGYPGVLAGSVYLTSWAMNGELNNSNAQHPMGVIAHELGHSMCGLPDLYDTANMNEGLGAFSIMAAGSWGRAATDLYSGTTPVSLDAWSRQYIGWTNPRPSSGGLVSFGPALATPDAPVKLANTGVSESEYFLVENRYSEGWDQGLERWLGPNWGGGLLVQHIDESIGTPGLNDINQYVPGNHQGVMAEEASTANGSLVAGTSAGHVTHLFYDGNNASFTDATTPDSRLYDGTSTNVEIFNISARAHTMTANLSILPSSVITSPANGSSFTATGYTITGNATDNSGAGLDKVEVSTDGGASWSLATGTTNWSY